MQSNCPDGKQDQDLVDDIIDYYADKNDFGIFKKPILSESYKIVKLTKNCLVESIARRYQGIYKSRRKVAKIFAPHVKLDETRGRKISFEEALKGMDNPNPEDIEYKISCEGLYAIKKPEGHWHIIYCADLTQAPEGYRSFVEVVSNLRQSPGALKTNELGAPGAVPAGRAFVVFSWLGGYLARTGRIGGGLPEKEIEQLLARLRRMDLMFTAYQEILSNYGRETWRRVADIIGGIKGNNVSLIDEAQQVLALMPNPNHIDIETGGEKNWINWFDLKDIDLSVPHTSRFCSQPCQHCCRGNGFFAARHWPAPIVIRKIERQGLKIDLASQRDEFLRRGDPFFRIHSDGYVEFALRSGKQIDLDITTVGWDEDDTRTQTATESIVNLFSSGSIPDEIRHRCYFRLSLHLCFPRPGYNLIQAIHKTDGRRVPRRVIKAYVRRYLNIIKTLGPLLRVIYVELTPSPSLLNRATAKVFSKALKQAGIKNNDRKSFVSAIVERETKSGNYLNGLPQFFCVDLNLNKFRQFTILTMPIKEEGRGGDFLRRLKLAEQADPRCLKIDMDAVTDKNPAPLAFPEVAVTPRGKVIVESVVNPGRTLVESSLDELDPVDYPAMRSFFGPILKRISPLLSFSISPTQGQGKGVRRGIAGSMWLLGILMVSLIAAAFWYFGGAQLYAAAGQWWQHLIAVINSGRGGLNLPYLVDNLGFIQPPAAAGAQGLLGQYAGLEWLGLVCMAGGMRASNDGGRRAALAGVEDEKDGRAPFSVSPIISRIDLILNSKAIRDEDCYGREYELWELCGLILQVYNRRHLRKIRNTLIKKGSKYKCVGAKIDLLFLVELLSSLIERRDDFYARFVERLQDTFKTVSPADCVESFGIPFIYGHTFQEVEKNRGQGIILESGFDSIKQLQRATSLLSGHYGDERNPERYIFAFPQALEQIIDCKPRSLILTATGASWMKDHQGYRVPKLDEFDTRPLFYEHTGELLSDSRKDAFVRDSKITLQTLGLIKDEKFDPKRQILVFTLGKTHASTVAHIVPWIFYLHTHPTSCGDPIMASGPDLVYEAFRSDWQSQFIRDLKTRLSLDVYSPTSGAGSGARKPGGTAARPDYIKTIQAARKILGKNKPGFTLFTGMGCSIAGALIAGIIIGIKTGDWQIFGAVALAAAIITLLLWSANIFRISGRIPGIQQSLGTRHLTLVSSAAPAGRGKRVRRGITGSIWLLGILILLLIVTVVIWHFGGWQGFCEAVLHHSPPVIFGGLVLVTLIWLRKNSGDTIPNSGGAGRGAGVEGRVGPSYTDWDGQTEEIDGRPVVNRVFGPSFCGRPMVRFHHADMGGRLPQGSAAPAGRATDLSSPVGVFAGVDAVNDNVGVLDVETDTVFADSESMSSRRQVDQGLGKMKRIAGSQIEVNLFNNPPAQLGGEFVEIPFAAGSELNSFRHNRQDRPSLLLIFSNGTNPNLSASLMPCLRRNANFGLMGRCDSMASMSQPTGLWYTYSLAGAVSSNLVSATQRRSHSEYVSNTKYLGAPFLSTTTAALNSLDSDALSSFGSAANLPKVSNLTNSFAGNLINDPDFISQSPFLQLLYLIWAEVKRYVISYIKLLRNQAKYSFYRYIRQAKTTRGMIMILGTLAMILPWPYIIDLFPDYGTGALACVAVVGAVHWDPGGPNGNAPQKKRAAPVGRNSALVGMRGAVFASKPFDDPHSHQRQIADASSGGNLFEAGKLGGIQAQGNELFFRSGEFNFGWFEFAKKLCRIMGIPKLTFFFKGFDAAPAGRGKVKTSLYALDPDFFDNSEMFDIASDEDGFVLVCGGNDEGIYQSAAVFPAEPRGDLYYRRGNIQHGKNVQKRGDICFLSSGKAGEAQQLIFIYNRNTGVYLFVFYPFKEGSYRLIATQVIDDDIGVNKAFHQLVDPSGEISPPFFAQLIFYGNSLRVTCSQDSCASLDGTQGLRQIDFRRKTVGQQPFNTFNLFLQRFQCFHDDFRAHSNPPKDKNTTILEVSQANKAELVYYRAGSSSPIRDVHYKQMLEDKDVDEERYRWQCNLGGLYGCARLFQHADRPLGEGAEPAGGAGPSADKAGLIIKEISSNLRHPGDSVKIGEAIRDLVCPLSKEEALKVLNFLIEESRDKHKEHIPCGRNHNYTFAVAFIFKRRIDLRDGIIDCIAGFSTDPDKTHVLMELIEHIQMAISDESQEIFEDLWTHLLMSLKRYSQYETLPPGEVYRHALLQASGTPYLNMDLLCNISLSLPNKISLVTEKGLHFELRSRRGFEYFVFVGQNPWPVGYVLICYFKDSSLLHFYINISDREYIKNGIGYVVMRYAVECLRPAIVIEPLSATPGHLNLFIKAKRAGLFQMVERKQAANFEYAMLSPGWEEVDSVDEVVFPDAKSGKKIFIRAKTKKLI
ncbi:MAG: hypothetical protein Q8O22_02405 [Candidatus Omnitrophota bacterium]|nr:hypothetical protein [Candidatus Omnitrophota bacterium]